ncbi:unnamed protein product [Bursaphelenchus okinawaensis]|uniref:HORMA domain-containing protein n=1 Tax=Bursaphelenchus okinawaensis TaxID=465554 RepID=A0A811JRM2_9BILA|nr:unnamed protein product [Bursaphelenchus okinawaensis]CAG9080398.1 unnamed protein product [Bursaphelenchus okinawaensis]
MTTENPAKSLTDKQQKQSIEEFDIGRQRSNRELECARIIVDFLECAFQKLALRYCKFEHKVLDSFCGVMFYRGAHPQIAKYMNDMRSTLRYWISHQHIMSFTVVIKDVKNEEEVAEVTIGFYSGLGKNWENLSIRSDVTERVKDRCICLFEKLDELPTREELLNNVAGREISAQIRCKLLPEAPHPNNVSGIVWDHDLNSLRFPTKHILYSAPRIDSEFVEFSLQCNYRTESV